MPDPMVWRLALVIVLAACSDASLGEGPEELAGSPDAAPSAADAVPEPDAEPVPADCEDPTPFYRDVDGDGYGDPGRTVSACEAPDGYVADNTDCDDGRRLVNPGATEVCGDLIDNDCSGMDPCAEAQVAHWTFDVDAGDRSGNNNDGALRNGAEITGGAAVFDGNNDYVEVAHDDGFIVDNGTLSVWFNADALGVDRGLWSKDSDGRDDGGHASLWVRGTGEVWFRLQSQQQSYSVESAPVAAGTNYHVVVTFGAGGVILYLNGTQVATNLYTGGTGGNREPIAIGASTRNSGDRIVTPIDDAFDGRVFDARFYNRALSTTEIAQLYAASAP